MDAIIRVIGIHGIRRPSIPIMGTTDIIPIGIRTPHMDIIQLHMDIHITLTDMEHVIPVIREVVIFGEMAVL